MARSSTTYQPNWKSGPTKVIRIPEAISQRVFEFARAIDDQFEGSIEEGDRFWSSVLDPLDRTKPINVSKTIHRSPFRYPGGKTWFVPYLRQWMKSFDSKPDYFIEPFAGGGICGLTVAFENWSNHVILSELDERVASVWRTILSGQAEWLAERIRSFDLLKENVLAELHRESSGEKVTLREKAFLTILRNRLQRGGIMAPGAGFVKNGENGRGLKSRWYPETLAKRIEEIGEISHKITFERVDGFDIIQRFADESRAVYFADPPYTKAAKRLYHHWEFDHKLLFKSFESVSGRFLMTYDNTEEIRTLAGDFGFEIAEIAMKNTHHAQMTELLISRDLSWLNSKP